MIEVPGFSADTAVGTHLEEAARGCIHLLVEHEEEHRRHNYSLAGCEAGHEGALDGLAHAARPAALPRAATAAIVSRLGVGGWAPGARA